jgi:hypothetical protein
MIVEAMPGVPGIAFFCTPGNLNKLLQRLAFFQVISITYLLRELISRHFLPAMKYQ